MAATIAACKKTKSGFWLAVARMLDRSRRERVEVNLNEIEMHANDGETVIVPGRVLGIGSLVKNVSVAGFWFSASAEKKLGKKALRLETMLSKHPDGKGLRIMA